MQKTMRYHIADGENQPVVRAVALVVQREPDEAQTQPEQTQTQPQEATSQHGKSRWIRPVSAKSACHFVLTSFKDEPLDPRPEPDDIELSPEHTVARLREAIASGDRDGAVLLAERIDDEDAEAIFDSLDASETSALFDLVGDEEFAELIVRLDDEHAADVLEQIPASDAADVLEELDPDDATDIFGELEPEHSDVIFVQMEPEEAQELRELLAYPPETAGGLMTPAFVSIAPTLRADQAIAALRKVAESAETVNYVYVTDPEDHLLGVLSLHRLVLTNSGRAGARPHVSPRPITVQAEEDQEEAARILTEHDLLALPVVDAENHILGIITVDDITEVLEREVTEDIERIGGSAPAFRAVSARPDQPALSQTHRLAVRPLHGPVCHRFDHQPLRLAACRYYRVELLHSHPDRHGRKYRLPDGDHDRPGARNRRDRTAAHLARADQGSIDRVTAWIDDGGTDVRPGA